jgi:hypothetical protein
MTANNTINEVMKAKGLYVYNKHEHKLKFMPDADVPQDLVQQHGLGITLKEYQDNFLILPPITHHKILENYLWFLTNQKQLLQQYHGKQLLIVNQHLENVYDDHADAYDYAVQHYGLGNFNIQECTDKVYEAHLGYFQADIQNAVFYDTQQQSHI